MTSNKLRLVLKGCWYDKINTGVKKHEYREVKPYWTKRIYGIDISIDEIKNYTPKVKQVELVKGYKKPIQTMNFEIKDIILTSGVNTDLKSNKPVFDIQLGQRL